MISGNTIKIKSTFYDINHTLVDPDAILFRVYDPNKKALYAKFLTIDNKISTGLYEINYTLPNESSITYEFNGVKDGFAIVNREEIKLSFS